MAVRAPLQKINVKQTDKKFYATTGTLMKFLHAASNRGASQREPNGVVSGVTKALNTPLLCCDVGSNETLGFVRSILHPPISN